MRYLKLYEDIDTSDKTAFELKDIEYAFAGSFDLCKSHEINKVYFHPDDYTDWSHDDFSEPNRDFPYVCAEGVCIEFRFEFENVRGMGNSISASGFNKYIEVTSEINGDIIRFSEMFKYNIISIDIGPRGLSIIIG